MKKKHLQLQQLKLNKETVLNMSSVKGGAPINDTGSIIAQTADCARTMQRTCVDTQGTVMPCCPGCRSGANNTVVKQFCTIIEQTMDCTLIPVDPPQA
ncbi:hypothetical protein [Taibaiella koreensis]|uniref:hypothetical protein n=1 Tax=Taibaiella koreensis TaxID=1268548 RepID=UPI0013C356D6|nr:hypothetical protein [Taibaiella koreensis]